MITRTQSVLTRFLLTTVMLVLIVSTFPSWLLARPPAMIYAPLGAANKIAEIDPKSLTVTRLIGPLDNPHGLAVTPDGKTLFAGSVAERVADGAKPESRPEGVSEEDHAAHHGGEKAAPQAPPRSYSFIARVDVASGKVTHRIDVEKFTHHVAVTPDGRWVIGVQSGAGRIVVVDSRTNQVNRYVNVGAAPNYALVSRDGNRVYVSSAGDNSITVLDGKSWARIADIPVGKNPEHMVFSPDQKRLYVVNVNSAELSIVDIVSQKEIQRSKTGTQPHGVAFLADSNTVITANTGGESLSIFDQNGREQQLVPRGPKPYHTEFIPEQGQLWVSSRQTGELWLVSQNDMTVKKTLTLPGTAHQLVYTQ